MRLNPNANKPRPPCRVVLLYRLHQPTDPIEVEPCLPLRPLRLLTTGPVPEVRLLGPVPRHGLRQNVITTQVN